MRDGGLEYESPGGQSQQAEKRAFGVEWIRMVIPFPGSDMLQFGSVPMIYADHNIHSNLRLQVRRGTTRTYHSQHKQACWRT